MRRLLVLLMCCVLPAHAGKVLTLLAEDDWYPYAALKDGKAVGMAVEIVQEAYQAVGVSVGFRSVPYARCMRLVEVGREVGCFNSLKDASTEPSFRFGKQPLFHAAISIYARSGQLSGVTVAQLAGKRVGLTNGYTYGSEVELNQDMIKDVAASDLISLRKLLLGRLDYVLVYSRVADHLITRYPADLAGKIQRVGTVMDNPLYLTFSKTNPHADKALQQLDRGLAILQKNGRYLQIVQRWDTRNG